MGDVGATASRSGNVFAARCQVPDWQPRVGVSARSADSSQAVPELRAVFLGNLLAPLGSTGWDPQQNGV